MHNFDFSFQEIVAAANDVIIVTKAYPIDLPGPEIVYVNKAFTKLTGYTFEEAVGQNPRILQSSDTDNEAKNKIRNALVNKQPVRVTIKNYTKTGKEYWLDLSILPLKNKAGKVTHFAAVERDVTEQKELERKLKALSRTDPLTGLLNRRSFEEISTNEFSRYKRSGEKYSFLMLDIDHFKSVNDKYGHATGDLALKSLARSCLSNLRIHDSVARIGGEEFCVILPYTNAQTALEMAEKLRLNVSAVSINAGTARISMTISIGVSEVDASDNDHSDILERADKALYKAKEAGRNQVSL